MDRFVAVALAFILASCAEPRGVTRTPALPPGPAVDVVMQNEDPNAKVTSEEVRAIFRPAAEPMQRCLAGKSGKITIRLTNRDGVLHAEIEPASSLDPTARACVLDALSTVWLEATGSNVGGPSVPPPGFASLLTIAW